MKVFEVSLVLTDAAIKCAIENNIQKKTVCTYIPAWQNEKLTFVKGLVHMKKVIRTEYADDETEKYRALYKALYDIVEIIDPEVVLRTTPVFGWGIDELIPSILRAQNKSERLRCYQECYCAGKALMDNENEIAMVGCGNMAVVDECAARHSAVPITIVTGYLNANCFSKNDYVVKRREARDQLGLMEKEKVFLYVASCIYDIHEELYHFNVFLKSVSHYKDSIKLFIKFHPRHTEADKETYQKCIEKSGCYIRVIENIDYRELLSFSDCMISLVSSVNIDAVNYFSSNFECIKEPVSFVSIYPYGKRVTSVMKRIYNTEFYPACDEKGCHMIVDEADYSREIRQVIQGHACSQELIKKYKENKNNYVNAVGRFVEYLQS